MKTCIVLVALAALVAVTGCLTDGGDADGGSFLDLPCKDPAPFEPPAARAAYLGYTVMVRDGLDVAAEASPPRRPARGLRDPEGQARAFQRAPKGEVRGGRARSARPDPMPRAGRRGGLAGEAVLIGRVSWL